jgi:hypothetical protein
MADPFYITTAIAYPNGKPHIGTLMRRSPPTSSHVTSAARAAMCGSRPARMSMV